MTKRLALAYAVTPQQTAKLSYQEGFRFADAWCQEWAAQINAQQGVHRSIAPETSATYEADYVVTGLLKQRLTLAAALYHSRYQDLQGYISSIGSYGNFTYGSFVNSDQEIASLGGELSADFHPREDWELAASYGYSQPLNSYETSLRLANQDDSWSRYPSHMVKFHLGHLFTPDLFVGVVGSWESAHYDHEQVTDPRVRELYDTWPLIINVNAWYRIDQHWTVGVSAKELLSHGFNQYASYFAGARPLDAPRPQGAQYFLSLRYAF